MACGRRKSKASLSFAMRVDGAFIARSHLRATGDTLAPQLVSVNLRAPARLCKC
jgi:hypothetical protein